MESELNILFIGDLVGRLGRRVTRSLLADLKKEHHIAFTIANGENSASGYGITEDVYKELVDAGIDCITMGNHMFDKRDFVKVIGNCPKIVRPANYPPDVPGKDHFIADVGSAKVAVINLLGRVFVQAVDCPFRVGAALVEKVSKEAQIIIIDIHAEATSEKCAIGHYFDGKVSAVLGTHTHVMTADERLLPNGTAYLSDVGMVGALDSIIGMTKEPIIARFLTQAPHHFEPVTKGKAIFNAVVLKFDGKTKKPKEILRINRVIEDLNPEA